MRVRRLIVFFAFSLLALCQPVDPAFEAASVRPNRSADPPQSRFPLGPGGAFVPGSLFAATNQPLIAYIRFAYKLGQSDLLDLPSWVYSQNFDIEARAPGAATKDQMRRMMRSLLVERFKLKDHVEQRMKPVFFLGLAKPDKTGPMLLPSGRTACANGQAPPASLKLPPIPCGNLGPLGDSSPGLGRLGGRAVTLNQIAGILMNPFTGVDRPVTNRTGLTGDFDFSLEWSLAPEGATIPGANPPPQGSDGPAFRQALQNQLGLKLASGTGPVETVIIDRLERPEEN